MQIHCLQRALIKLYLRARPLSLLKRTQYLLIIRWGEFYRGSSQFKNMRVNFLKLWQLKTRRNEQNT